MKTVIISQRIDIIRNERRDSLDHAVYHWAQAQDYLPIPIPNTLERPLSWIQHINPDWIILSGGNDIGQYPERDHTETELLNYAKEHRIKTLGICRGMQMMGIWAGATLIPVTHHVGTTHQLSTGTVNSYHNFALKECPSHFIVTERAEDGVIEAIKHTLLPFEGIMWHPERSL